MTGAAICMYKFGIDLAEQKYYHINKFQAPYKNVSMYNSKISRKWFTDWLASWRDKDVIKVVTGIRRCGKTTLFELFREQLVESGLAADRIIAINFEDPDCASFASWREAWEFIKPNIKPDGRTYVFLDEVQNVPEFEKLVDGLYSRKNLDVYITGSNAKFLSGELATFLTGRYVEIRLQPLHFTEYRTLFPDKDAYSVFNDFLRFGGFPFAAQLTNGSRTQLDYLSGILDTILYKDVMARNGYRDAATLKRIVRFLFDNIGNMLSVNKIVGMFKSEGFSMPHATLDTYIDALCQTFLLARVDRYNIKGRQYLKTTAKYYVADTGLRRTLLGTKGEDFGHLLENVVYLELHRRFREIYVGVLNKGEIDFVTFESGRPCYFQVAYTVRDEATLARELAPLKSIRDNHPKFLLTLDNDPPLDHDGINRMNVVDFLLDPRSLETL